MKEVRQLDIGRKKKKLLKDGGDGRSEFYIYSARSESGSSQRNARSSISCSAVSLKAVVSPVRVVIFTKLFAALMMVSNLLAGERFFLIDERYPFVIVAQFAWLKSVIFVDSLPVALLMVLMIALDRFLALWAATVSQETNPSLHRVSARSTCRYVSSS